MGLLDRVAMLLRANLNDLIDRAEDPEVMVKQVLADLHNQLIQVKTQVAVAIADEQHLYTTYKGYLDQAQQWQSRAELAVGKGDDGLAREALLRRNTARENARTYGAQWEEQQRQVELLKSAMTRLKAKIDEAERKQELLLARRRRAEAERAIAEILGNVNDRTALASLDKLNHTVQLEEARAKAATALNGEQSIEERFAELESVNELDDDLAELKARIKPPQISEVQPEGRLGPRTAEASEDPQPETIELPEISVEDETAGKQT